MKSNILNEQEKVKKLVKMFLSERLKSVFQNMLKTGDPLCKAVVKKFLELDGSDELQDFTYVDLVKGPNGISDSELSFLPAPRAWRLLNFQTEQDSFERPSPDSDVWTSSQRQPAGIGRMISKLFSDTFSADAVARFVGSFKAEIEAVTVFDRFSVVEGENIRHWYSEKNYAQGGGSLNGSCMRYDKAQGYLDMYCKNPDKCSLVIYKNRDGKLLGRALLWKGLKKPTGKTFMDRIYTVNQRDEDLFKKYAKQNGWLYKYSQSAQDASYMDGDNRVYDSLALALYPVPYKVGEDGKIIIISKDIPKYSKYPYMDTMKYFTPETGRLASDIGERTQWKKFRLESTEGSATPV